MLRHGRKGCASSVKKALFQIDLAAGFSFRKLPAQLVTSGGAFHINRGGTRSSRAVNRLDFLVTDSAIGYLEIDVLPAST